jgi:hypothetical protein
VYIDWRNLVLNIYQWLNVLILFHRQNLFIIFYLCSRILFTNLLLHLLDHQASHEPLEATMLSSQNLCHLYEDYNQLSHFWSSLHHHISKVLCKFLLCINVIIKPANSFPSHPRQTLLLKICLLCQIEPHESATCFICQLPFLWMRLK